MKKLLTRILKSFIIGVVVVSSLSGRSEDTMTAILNRIGRKPLILPDEGLSCVSKTFTKSNYAKLSAQKIAQKKFARESENKDKNKENYTNYSLSKKIPFVKEKINDSYFKRQTRGLTQKEFEILQELVEINQGNIPKSWEQFYLLTDTNFFTFNQTYKKY